MLSQGQDFASGSLALSYPKDRAVLWHQRDQNLPVAANCLHNSLSHFSKLLRQ